MHEGSNCGSLSLCHRLNITFPRPISSFDKLLTVWPPLSCPLYLHPQLILVIKKSCRQDEMCHCSKWCCSQVAPSLPGVDIEFILLPKAAPVPLLTEHLWVHNGWFSPALSNFWSLLSKFFFSLRDH